MAEIAFARLDELTSTWEQILDALAQAEQARDAAKAAQNGAENAEQGAVNAKGAAEIAQLAAETAKGLAETAQGFAEDAQGFAEGAQAAAENAQDGAETAQGLAEDAQEAAEDARDFAHLWSSEGEDVPVNDGVHTGYSAFHWAEKAAASAGGTGGAYTVFGTPGGTPAVRTDITLANDTVLGRDASGDVDDIKIKVPHIHTDAKTGADQEVVTGTAGTSGHVATWNVDGDLVGGGIAASNIYYAGGADVAIADGGTGASTALNAFNALKQTATDSYAGVVELATAAEVATGTDTDRAATPSAIAGAAIYGYIPQVPMSADYTLLLSDQSKHIFHNEDNPRTLTVPPNASVPFPIGATILVVNNTNTLTLTQGSGVYFVWVPSLTGGNRTLAAGGVATLLYIGSNYWYVYGVGIS